MNGKRLYRSQTDTIIGGVAAGLAGYLNTDPALVRIAWALLVPLTGGAALLAYIVAWVVVPEEPGAGAAATGAPADGPPTEPPTDPVTGEVVEPAPARSTSAFSRPASDNRAGIVVGIGLVLLGLFFLLREYLPSFDWGLVWPLVLVGIGGVILVTAMRRRNV